MKKEIYSKMKKEITSGKILPGTSIIEREISEKYSISRTPVREILWHLASDGLLIKDYTGGYVVRKISLDEIINLFQSREGIEGMAAKLSCQKGDRHFFLELDQLSESLKNINIEKDPKGSVFYGRKLHDAIISAANNPFLTDFYKKLRTISSLTRSITKYSSHIEKNSLDSHLKIINAIQEKDEGKAEHYMREHLKVTCKLMIEYFYPSLLN